jgi:dihydroorotase-like cyclic amidohydrolase
VDDVMLDEAAEKLETFHAGSQAAAAGGQPK